MTALKSQYILISDSNQKSILNEMNFSDLYKTLAENKYYVFSYQDLFSFFPKENSSNVKNMLCRWKDRGWIRTLKRGLYEIAFPKDLYIPDLFIANVLYRPSYVSLETALSIYSIIPEVAMAVTSVATKATRKFRNKHGLFIYRTVKPAAFMGYYVRKEGDFNILLAEPEKAIVDYLHFKTFRNRKFSIQEERIDRKIISKLNKKKMDNYAKLYNMSLKEFYAHL